MVIIINVLVMKHCASSVHISACRINMSVYIMGFFNALDVFVTKHTDLFFNVNLSFSYPYPTKWGWYHMFSSCCDKDSAIIFTTGRLPDVNPP
jgi:hypothetical protein